MHSCIDWESCGYDHPSTLGATVARGYALVWTTLDRERWGSKGLEGTCFRLGSSLPKRATVRVVVFIFRIVVSTRSVETVTWDQCIIVVTIMTGKVVNCVVERFTIVAAFTRGGENLFWAWMGRLLVLCRRTQKLSGESILDRFWQQSHVAFLHEEVSPLFLFTEGFLEKLWFWEEMSSSFVRKYRKVLVRSYTVLGR